MASAPPYPLFLNLAQRPVLVVGGGAVGLRKTRGLIECATRVTVVSPQFTPDFEQLSDIELIAAPYAAVHMAHKRWRLVFAATNVPEVNALVYAHAAAAGILCCRSDDPEEADFTSGACERIGANRNPDGTGSPTHSGGLLLAVSTAGASPALAARICRQAAAGIDPVLPLLADLLSNWRAPIKSQITRPGPRRQLLLRLAGEEMESTLRRHGPDAAQRLFLEWLATAKRDADTSTTIPAAPDPNPIQPSQTVKHAD